MRYLRTVIPILLAGSGLLAHAGTIQRTPRTDMPRPPMTFPQPRPVAPLGIPALPALPAITLPPVYIPPPLLSPLSP